MLDSIGNNFEVGDKLASSENDPTKALIICIKINYDTIQHFEIATFEWIDGTHTPNTFTKSSTEIYFSSSWVVVNATNKEKSKDSQIDEQLKECISSMDTISNSTSMSKACETINYYHCTKCDKEVDENKWEHNGGTCDDC